MPLSRIDSTAIQGLDAVLVHIEVDVTREVEKPSLVIVGLPDAAVKESKDRVLTSIKNSSLQASDFRSTINLAPGNLKKEGPLYDLPIAIALLNALGLIKGRVHEDYLVMGELGLGGETRPIRGALAIAMLAKQLKKKGVILPHANAREAATVPGIQVIPIRCLKDAVQLLNQPQSLQPVKNVLREDFFAETPPPVDFADIKGQEYAKRALEIAAAGNHNLLLCGPPGSGKTMLAKALVGIMPELTVEEALESSKIHSIVGLLPKGQSLVKQRAFRSPHHTISYAGLIGGGSCPRPGEVSLAHHGILFLDELPEFSRKTLEVLRQPLEDRQVTISRSSGNFTYPTSFLCIAAMNPCPCGYLGHPEKRCKDSFLEVNRYRSKISGPLLDRLDMHIEVPALRFHELADRASGETSQNIRRRVKAARAIQAQRFQKNTTNALMTSQELKEHCPLDANSLNLLKQASESMGISARAYDRILKVARTIADLAQSPSIQEKHLMEAVNFRHWEKDGVVA